MAAGFYMIAVLSLCLTSFGLGYAIGSNGSKTTKNNRPRNDMLIIFNEGKYKEFKKSCKKPSDFCKEDLKMPDVKSYDFVKNYFNDPMILVTAIKKYHEISKVPKGEYTLMDLLQ